MPKALVAIAVAAFALAAIEFYALSGHSPLTTPPGAAAPPPAVAPVAASHEKVPVARPEGWIDQPPEESVRGNRIELAGWALDRAGIRSVEVRVDGKPYPADYGIARPDVAAVKPGFPDTDKSGFRFEGDFSNLPPVRHEVVVVAINRSGVETVLGRRSLVPEQALRAWTPLLDARSALARQPFYFLMMTSGVVQGGADEMDAQYRDYVSRTQLVGMAVPILYMRTTRGQGGDWVFDPDFDLSSHRCGKLAVAEDNLNGVIRYAIAKKMPVQFILNGGIWGDASCETPEWDLTDHLEQDLANDQWTQDDRVFPDDYLKGHAGSTESPQLARSLTYHVYARDVRRYKRRNLQAAARIVARFAREHPSLFVGVVLDSDTYMNPFFRGEQTFDYNPGMLRQFRDWLRADGPYAGKPADGAPDLSAYRRGKPLSLGDVNAIARKAWSSWDEVDPPRKFPGSLITPEVSPGAVRIWDDPWWHLWEEFRKHIVDLHYDELSSWVHETGIPADRIFSAQGFIRPDPGRNPFAVRIDSHGQNYDSSGVSIEGSIPRDGHLGAVIYGEAARNEVEMEVPHSLMATFARMDEGWGVVEMNSSDLKRPKDRPPYEWTYRSLRDIFNYGAREISLMAWNGSNGLFAEQPDYSPYTAWRNTPGEDAMRDFLVSHADVPFGAKLWTFGTSSHADDDGWTTSKGTLSAGRGHVAVAPDAGVVTIVSPADQVIRPSRIDLAVVRVGGAVPQSIVVEAQSDSKSPWTEVGRSATERVALKWPASWRDAIVERVRITLQFPAGTEGARVERVLLYPAADAYRGGVRSAVRKASG